MFTEDRISILLSIIGIGLTMTGWQNARFGSALIGVGIFFFVLGSVRTRKTKMTYPAVRYPEHYDNWRGTILKKPQSRRIDPGIEIRRQYKAGDAVPFVPAIGHEGKGRPLEQASMVIEFLGPVPEVTAGGDWQTQIPNCLYTYHAKRSLLDERGSANAALSIVFPKPETYPVRFTIKGLWIRPIVTPFTFNIYP